MLMRTPVGDLPPKVDHRVTRRVALVVGLVGASLSVTAGLARLCPALGDRAMVAAAAPAECPDYARRVAAYRASLELKFVTAERGLHVCDR